MVMQLIPFTIGIAVAIIVILAIFSILPDVVVTFSCPDPASFGAGTANTTAAAWAQGCVNISTQTTIVPALIGLAVVVAAILVVARMFQ